MQRVKSKYAVPRVGSEIVVPGSIANLGPGFDTLALAVSLYLKVRVTRVIDDGDGRLTCRFGDAPPLGHNHIRRAFDAFPAKRGRRPSLEVEVTSDIPQRAGLGSSAAAAIAGLRLRELVDGPVDPDEMLSAAFRLDRHPDNVAAALLGGLTSSSVSDGRVSVARWRWPEEWRLIVATPDVPLLTSASRRVLPKKVSLADAVFNLQRVALLLGAVESGRPAGLRAALADRLHQPYRQRVVPGLREALALRHPDVMGVCLSGAGPSVVVFARRRFGAAAEALAAVYRKARVPCSIRTLKAHPGSDGGTFPGSEGDE